MYCVIQEIERKKADSPTIHKELESISFLKQGIPYYSYIYSDEIFEMPIKPSYKISIRESYRENGIVKAKQWVLCTISYYSLAQDGYYDAIENKIDKIAAETGKSFNEIYKIAESKIDPLYEQTKEEFQQTDAYKTEQEQNDIIRRYAMLKTEFEKLYGIGQYDFCYDVFGNLRNEAYLKKLQDMRSYREKFYSNYNYNYDSSSYQTKTTSNYTEEDKNKLKKCFKVLAKYFHPDNTTGDSEMMQFVNDTLKKEWGL